VRVCGKNLQKVVETGYFHDKSTARPVALGFSVRLVAAWPTVARRRRNVVFVEAAIRGGEGSNGGDRARRLCEWCEAATGALSPHWAAVAWLRLGYRVCGGVKELW
jgi:hypothetical protein